MSPVTRLRLLGIGLRRIRSQTKGAFWLNGGDPLGCIDRALLQETDQQEAIRIVEKRKGRDENCLSRRGCAKETGDGAGNELVEERGRRVVKR